MLMELSTGVINELVKIAQGQLLSPDRNRKRVANNFAKF
jgi:hypothetical protein